MGENSVKRVILDVDMGTDDCIALLILLYADRIGKVKLEAIVCSVGNTSLDHVVRNVVRTLEMLGRKDIPIYKGTEKQLILHKEPILRYHGRDGFGDLHHDTEPDISIVRDTPAAIAIRNIINESPKEISVICVGPLTNLALAIKLYSDLVANIKDVWIMGGNHSAVGNVTSAAEFNFYVDPEAAYITLECLTCPIFILPWESCQIEEMTFEWRYKLLEDKTPIWHLLSLAEKSIYDDSFKYWCPCDAFLTFCFLNPEKHITKQSRHHAVVELNGRYTRGQVVLDHLKTKRPNTTMIEKIHGELFKEVILKTTSL